MFLDYNQNAKDRTVAGAYSVRPQAGRARLGAADLGGARRSATRPTSRCARCRRASRRSATATPRIDEHPCSLEPLLELSARQEAEGLGDAPWPPHYAKQAGEPPRVPAVAAQGRAARRAAAARPPSRSSRSAAPRKKEDALAGLERWKARHPEAAAHLQPADVLVDSMRGRSSTWTRVRVNLEHVPEATAAAQEPLESDYDPWAGQKWTEEEIAAWKASQRSKRRPPERVMRFKT